MDEIIVIKHGFAFKGEFFSKEGPGDILMTPGNFAIGGGFQWGKRKYYAGPVPAEYVLRPGDLIVTMTDLSKEADSLGYPAIVPFHGERLLHNQRIGKVVKRSESVDLRFLYWLMRSQDYRNEVLASITGSTVKHTSPKKILAFQFSLPPLSEQIAIASVLDALDDKIDLHRRTNETLEAIVRAIFKDWFIDFGPTRAKMEGRSPYLAPDIWELFPDRLEDKGNPQGWPIKPLRHFGDTSVGGYWGDDKAQDDTSVQFVCLRGVDLEHLRSNGSCPQAPVRWGKYSAISKRPITDCDVLVAGSGAGPCGRPLWLSTHASALGALPITYSNFVKRITCTSPASACFLDQVLHEMRLTQEIWSYVNGTSVPNLNEQGLLDGKMIAIPSEAILRAFMEFIRPTHAKLFSGETEPLAATRDLLLPKLLSGEIRVKDASAIAQAAQ